MTNKNDELELLPCPFCGGGAEIMEGVGETWINCSNLCQKMRGVGSIDVVKKAWNTRADKPLSEDRKKALEGALRYLLKVGYNHGRTQFEDGQKYDDDFGKNFDLETLRNPEKKTIRAALQDEKPCVDVEDKLEAYEKEYGITVYNWQEAMSYAKETIKDFKSQGYLSTPAKPEEK